MAKIGYNAEDIVDHQGVAVVLKNKKGEVLMQQHVKYGFWTIPVGKVKDWQSVEEGLKEEIFEECNITVEEFKEITTKEYAYNRNGNKVKVFAHLFEVDRWSGRMKNKEPKKHKIQIFMPLNKIKKLPYLSDLTLLYLETVGLKRKARL
ncbi:NUDIX hydrolase [Candidatus Woesearchaeota archaeon]|nr:NUDIX hydrolase [Candidatus Woesearchaeota archaeon]